MWGIWCNSRCVIKPIWEWANRAKIKLTGAHEDHKEAQKDAQRYKTLYEESQQILSNYQSQSILKKTEDAKGITSKIDQIMEKHKYSPIEVEATSTALNLDSAIDEVKNNVLENVNNLAKNYVDMSVRIKCEKESKPPIYEFRQTYQTMADGSLALVSSVPIVKREPIEMIQIDSD